MQTLYDLSASCAECTCTQPAVILWLIYWFFIFSFFFFCSYHSTQGVTVSLNATSEVATSFELSEHANDQSVEQDSEYEQGEDELGYDKSEVPEEYSGEYTEEGQYEGQEAELTEDQIEYGEDQGEEEIYNDGVLDLEINEPLDDFTVSFFLLYYLR